MIFLGNKHVSSSLRAYLTNNPNGVVASTTLSKTAPNPELIKRSAVLCGSILGIIPCSPFKVPFLQKTLIGAQLA